MLAELWWRAVSSRPDAVAASVATATGDAALAASAPADRAPAAPSLAEPAAA